MKGADHAKTNAAFAERALEQDKWVGFVRGQDPFLDSCVESPESMIWIQRSACSSTGKSGGAYAMRSRLDVKITPPQGVPAQGMAPPHSSAGSRKD